MSCIKCQVVQMHLKQFINACKTKKNLQGALESAKRQPQGQSVFNAFLHHGASEVKARSNEIADKI